MGSRVECQGIQSFYRISSLSILPTGIIKFRAYGHACNEFRKWSIPPHVIKLTTKGHKATI